MDESEGITRNRSRGATCLTLAAALFAASIGPATAAPETRKGTFRISATVSLGPNVTAKEPVVGSANISAFGALSSGAFAVQSLNLGATLKRSGKTATVTIDVPYSFTIDSAQFATQKVSIYFNVSGSIAFASTGLSVPFPANGATTPVSFALAI